MLKIGINAIQRAACAGITAGSAVDCVNPLKSGVAERLLLGNLADIEEVIYDVVDTAIITNIVMKPGKQMFAFDGIRSSNVPEIGFISGGDQLPSFTHQMAFKVYEVDQAQKNNLQAMSVVKQFAIYQNPKDSSLGDSVFEVMGVNVGLEMSDLTRAPQSKDGSYGITLLTPELASETSLPNSFFQTDIPTTEALIDALLIPAVGP